MSATVIPLHKHSATMPRIPAGTPHFTPSKRVSASLSQLANEIALISCAENKKGSDRKNMAICLWRLSEGLDALADQASRLEHKFKKAKKRARR